MPLTATTLTFPEGVEAVHAGDVDGDGRDELILESRRKVEGKPDAVTLTVLPLGPDGRAGLTRSFPLENRAGLWDADKGLWLVDREGLVRLDRDHQRIASFPSVVAALGPTTPRKAPLTHDLDGDGSPELVAWSAGKYLVFRADGSPFGSIPAPSRGQLATDFEQGGDALRATIEPPPLVVGDVNADGLLDLLLPSHKQLRIFPTGATVGATSQTVALPLDLDPPRDTPLQEGETRREVSGVWIQDLDGDKRVDLAVQRTVLTGSWFGATTELLFARGANGGFSALQSTAIPQAAFALRPEDVNDDGRLEILAALVDVGMGNLARALVSKSVNAQLTAYTLGTSGYGEPRGIQTLRFPLDHPDDFHAEIHGDVDGDRHVDLVTDNAGDTLLVYRGSAAGFGTTPAWTHALDVPPGDTLFVHELTGDKRAEILVWEPRRTTATLLRVP